MPLYFVENRGQVDPRVLFYAKGSTNGVYFTTTGIVFRLTSRVGGRPERSRVRAAAWSPRHSGDEPVVVQHGAIRLDFEGANPRVKMVGRDRTAAVVSYFNGERSDRKTALPTYAGVVYEELWPGIDLVYGSESGRPKYSFHVKPGADPDRIRLVYRGASGMRLTEAGRLEVETPVGNFGEDRPYAYQEGPRSKTEVEAAFEREGKPTNGEFRFGFKVGAYDRTRTLVLDPVQLAYCGYIGGWDSEEYWWGGIAVDSSGAAYVAGSTWSDGTTEGFPVVPGSWNTTNTGQSVFVAKVKPDGTGLVYCGYLGGGYAGGIAVDGSGNAYVTGRTSGGIAATAGSWDTTYSAGFDAFVAKINATGTAVVYCGYLGGSGEDWGEGIAVDGSGNAYVVGFEDSPTKSGPASGKFPVTAGAFDETWAGTWPDAFVAKINATGTAPLVYCTLLGGTNVEEGRAIAVDGFGRAYVMGYTTSSEAQGFPILGMLDPTFNGGSDIFVTKLNETGTGLQYSGFIGGPGNEDAERGGIAVDSAGYAYVVGNTMSGVGFPTVPGSWDTTLAGGNDVFVAKINQGGFALVYAGFIGGSGTDIGSDVAVDGSGNAYVVGWTDSTETDGFPVTAGPDLTYNGGWGDVFVAKVKADGSALDYCGYIGGTRGSGNDFDRTGGIAVDGSGNAYVFGLTDSPEATFPETVGPDLSFNGGSYDLFVAKITSTPTAVELSSFSATAGDSAVDLSWETGSEVSNLGFYLYRATAEEGPYTRITTSLVPGLGTSPTGASYSWHDSGLVNGTTYYYKLEDVETTGRTELHGPVSATPQTPQAPPEPAPPAPPEPPAPEPPVASPAPTPPEKLAYGDPTQVSLRVVERTPRSLTLDLETGGFYAEPLPDGTVRLSVPGFETLSQPGLPSLPVERTMVEALVGLGVRVASIQARDVAVFSSLRPEAAGLPELVVSADGTVRARVRAARRALSRGAYPTLAARVVSVGFQGEVKKALVELCPLRWDEASARLLLARRLRVRVVFSGLEGTELGRGARGRRGAPRVRPAGLIADLATREAGLHGVRFEELFGAQSRGVPTSLLSLRYQGTDVAFFIAPDPTRFAPGSTLFFLSAGEAANPYGNEAVYELVSDRGGLRMAQASALPAGGAALLEAVASRQYETNRHYLSSLTTAPDPWLWEYLRRGERKSVVLSLSQLAAGGGRIEIALMGVSDYPVSPDHHVRAFLNGASLGEVSWDGKVPARLVADVPPGALRDGSNSLELESVADTPASESLVYLDRVSLSYPRALLAESGRFEASFSLSGDASVGGLGAGAALLDTTGPVPVWLTGAEPSPSGLHFRAEGGHRYLAVSPEAMLAPEVRLAPPSTLRARSNQADYILLAPRVFLAEAEPLLAHRRAQGLAAMGVAAEEVYAQFGHGEARPEAIRNFLAYAFHNWAAPAPRYVLLLGDASYDPKNYLGSPPRTLLPTPLIRSSFLFTASDPSLAEVNGEDGLPDVAIGRLPATTVEEARSLVEKLIAWEDSGHSLQGPATLVSDNPDQGGDFDEDAEEIAHTVLAFQDVEHLSLARLGATATRAAIKDSFARGVSLMSYIGHGAIMLWASEQLLAPTDVDALSPQSQQGLVVAMTCLNGFFHLPAGNSLSEKLLKVEGKGAIATFSSSGMSYDSPAHRYHKALLGEIVSGRHERLGDALLAAQAAYADSGADPELLALYHLLGDPALRIR